MRLLIVIHVVHPGQPWHQALDRVVRAGHAGEHLGDREPDGEQNAVEDVEGQHAGERAEREQQLAAAEPGQPAEAGDVDEPDGSVDHDGTEGGGREVGQQRA